MILSDIAFGLAWLWLHPLVPVAAVACAAGLALGIRRQR